MKQINYNEPIVNDDLESSLVLFEKFCKNFNFKINLKNINFFLDHKSQPITVNNHIFPVAHYSSWLSGKKKKNQKNRDRKIDLLDLNTKEYSSLKLDSFSSREYLFTQELESMFTKCVIEDYSSNNNTEKMGSIDDLVNKINQKLITGFYLYQGRKSGSYTISYLSQIHQQHEISLKTEIDKFCNERAEKNIYFSFLMARNKIYEIGKGTKNIGEITLRILHLIKKEHKKYRLIIDIIMSILFFYLCLERFMFSTKKYNIIENIAGLKKIFNSFWLKYKNQLIKQYSKIVLDNFISTLTKTEIHNSYFCTLINSFFVTENIEFEQRKQRKSHYLIIYSDNKKLITREPPLFCVEYNNHNMFEFRKIPKKIDKRVLFMAYHPNLLILSGSELMIKFFSDLAKEDNSVMLYDYYNLRVLRDSLKNKFKVIIKI